MIFQGLWPAKQPALINFNVSYDKSVKSLEAKQCFLLIQCYYNNTIIVQCGLSGQGIVTQCAAESGHNNQAPGAHQEGYFELKSFT